MSIPEDKKHLGIPEAKFVEDVDKFMADRGDTTAEKGIRSLDELYQKYKMMEMSLNLKKQKLQGQVPDIKTTLEILNHLNEIKDKNETMETHFLLSGSLRSKASIPPTKEVGLWLGANVMLNYSIEDAQELLTKNLELAEKNIEALSDDLDYLRDQCTTTEVSMARLYNWDVMRRRNVKEATK